MRFGSLFSGIGGLDLGLERAGMSVAWQCEIEPYCRAVLAHHWPGVVCYDDIRSVGASAEPVDLICGGFPCQPVSLAGKGLAQEDPRWLWPEFARVVGDLRPRYVLVENVPGLVKRGLDIVVTGLAEMGYDAEWQIVSAASVGAPHLRERLFVVACSNGDSHGCEGFAEPHRESQPDSEASEQRDDAHGLRDSLADPAGSGRLGWSTGITGDVRVGAKAERSEGEQVAPRSGDLLLADSDGSTRGSPWAASEAVFRPEAVERLGRRGSGGGDVQDADSGSLESWGLGRRAAQASSRWWWSTEPDVGRVAHGVPHRLAQLRSLGNAVVPQVAEFVGRLILEAEGAARAA